jgi:L-asparaginase
VPEEEEAPVQHLAVIGTGGTIANSGGGPLDALSYLDEGPILPVDKVVERFPLIEEIARIEAIPFATMSSRDMGPASWVALRATVVEQLARDDVDGVVVTHGTATLEETAYFLSLTVPSSKPLVVVGAQRPAATVGSDVYSNLLAAVRVAASPQASGQGCLVVMNETIHSAREVTKGSNHRLETMRSPGLGPLGWVDPDGTVLLYRSTRRRHTATSRFSSAELWAEPVDLPRVDVAYGYAGADGAEIAAFIERGAQGIVVAGLAPALNPDGQERQLERAVEAGIAVVQGSRAGGGRVIARPTRRRLATVPTTDNLTAQSARVLLLVALTAGVPPAGLQDVFDHQ